MHIAVLSKGIVVSITLSLFAAYSVYFFNPGLFNSYEEWHIYATSETNQSTPNEPLIHAKETTNFKCQITENKIDKQFNCKIHELIEFTNKQGQVSSLSQTNSFKDALQQTLQKEKNFFRLIVSSKDWMWNNNHSEKINIIETKVPSTNNKYGILTPIFATLGTYKYKTKSNYLLINYKNTDALTKGSDEYQCKWNETEWKRCYVYDFSNTKNDNKHYSELNFKSPDDEATIIEKSNYYLIKFEDSTTKSTLYIKLKNAQKEITIKFSTPTFYDEVKKQLFVFE